MSWRRLEWGLLILGLILTGYYVAVRVHNQISSRLAVQKFEATRMEARTRAQESAKELTGTEVDFSLWSEKRIRGYMESLTAKEGAASAVLGIPKLNLEVPVYDGTDDLTLDRGVGRIIGTARLGEVGNTGIAGHRDGFFRGLKDIARGDRIDLVLPNQTSHYVVENIQITSPDDVSVLRPGPKASLTLVTCYPFYFVGSAPQRFIVSASFAGFEPSEVQPPGKLAVPQLNTKERLKWSHNDL